MGSLRRSFAALVTAVLTAGLATGCATAAGSMPGEPSEVQPRLGEVNPPLPGGEVIGEGLVLDTAGDATLCLYEVMESYPPQCTGLPLANWSWDGLNGFETAAGISWGSYALHGTYDGGTLTLTRAPILLALFDPPARPQPEPTAEGERPDEETLMEIHNELRERMDHEVFIGNWDGRVRVGVAWDDGTLQRAADAEFGSGVVRVESALRLAG